jgi:hypothetical protein
MTNWLGNLLMDPRGGEIAQTVVRAQRDALFTPSFMSDAVRRIDPSRANDEELIVALEECAFYWNTAYPETENELVEWIESACVDEVLRREIDIALPPRYQHAYWRE